jgi:hypothetical protein
MPLTPVEPAPPLILGRRIEHGGPAMRNIELGAEKTKGRPWWNGLSIVSHLRREA